MAKIRERFLHRMIVVVKICLPKNSPSLSPFTARRFIERDSLYPSLYAFFIFLSLLPASIRTRTEKEQDTNRNTTEHTLHDNLLYTLFSLDNVHGSGDICLRTSPVSSSLRWVFDHTHAPCSDLVCPLGDERCPSGTHRNGLSRRMGKQASICPDGSKEADRVTPTFLPRPSP